MADEPPHDTWFIAQRIAWIVESVQIFGHINREHICRKFAVTMAIASTDLAKVMDRYPDLMTYSRSTKRYERNGD